MIQWVLHGIIYFIKSLLNWQPKIELNIQIHLLMKMKILVTKPLLCVNNLISHALWHYHHNLIQYQKLSQLHHNISYNIKNACYINILIISHTNQKLPQLHYSISYNIKNSYNIKIHRMSKIISTSSLQYVT